LNSGLSTDFSVQLNISLSERLSSWLNQKVKSPNDLNHTSVPAYTVPAVWLNTASTPYFPHPRPPKLLGCANYCVDCCDLNIVNIDGSGNWRNWGI